MKNLSKVVVVASLLVMCLTTTVFGAQSYFTATLKPYQEDIEVSTIRKASSAKSFVVTLSYIEAGNTDMICVWAENYTTDANYSNPYKQIAVGLNEIAYYSDSIPAVGINVTLNMDNPVRTAETVDVAGVWTPN